MEYFGLVLVLLSVIVELFSEFTNSISLNESTKNNHVSAKLLYGDSAGISWSDLAEAESLMPLLTEKHMEVIAIDYHFKHGLVFFSAWRHIFRANITEEPSAGLTEHSVLVKNAGARTLAVDWMQDHLYWAENHSLHRVNLDGSGIRSVLERPHSSGNILSIVLDPYARLLFVAEGADSWTYDLRNGLVRCLPLRRMRIVNLALSVRTRVLYVSTRSHGAPRLFSCQYDGTKLIEYRIDQAWWRQLVAITVFRNQLFWIHRGWFEKDTVWKANVSTNSSISWEMEVKARGSDEEPEININTLVVYHPETQTRSEYNEEDEFQINTNVEEAIAQIAFTRVEGSCQDNNAVVHYSNGSKDLPYLTCLLFILLCFVIH